jgi:hypothetical protein
MDKQRGPSQAPTAPNGMAWFIFPVTPQAITVRNLLRQLHGGSGAESTTLAQDPYVLVTESELNQ